MFKSVMNVIQRVLLTQPENYVTFITLVEIACYVCNYILTTYSESVSHPVTETAESVRRYSYKIREEWRHQFLSRKIVDLLDITASVHFAWYVCLTAPQNCV
jgi:hypothetical protein